MKRHPVSFFATRIMTVLMVLALLTPGAPHNTASVRDVVLAILAAIVWAMSDVILLESDDDEEQL